MNQIKDKGYIERYRAWLIDSPEYEIHLLGINFSSKERNIDDWNEEILK